MDKNVYWIWLLTIFGYGSTYYKKLVNANRSAKSVFEKEYTYEDLSRLDSKFSSKLIKKDLTEALEVIRKCEKVGAKIVSIEDDDYPKLLKEIDNPPAVLFYFGTLPKDEPLLTIVGTRKPDSDGVSVANRFSMALAELGFSMVSGYAVGIDITANKACIKKNRYNIAVLACGIDVEYPYVHRKYKKEIIKNGCVMTEFLPGVREFPGNFKIRNRIMSGLSLGTLIVEAPKASGAIITANHALDQGRDLFVVPGGISDKNFEGSNLLIKNGGKLTSSPLDIIEEYINVYPEIFAKTDVSSYTIEQNDDDKPNEEFDIDSLGELNQTEKSIVYNLIGGKKTIDELVSKTKIAINTLLASLTLLEIKNIVKGMPGNYFEIIKEKRR